MIIVLLMICLFYWRIRNLYYNSLSLEYEHKLFDLRDKTRMYAIDKKINESDFFFTYLDNSISITITKIKTLNIFSSLFLFFMHRKEAKLAEFKETINAVTISNNYAQELYVEYGKIIVDYLIKKHYFIVFIAKVFYKLLIGVRSVNSSIQKIKSIVKDIRLYPETSASYYIVSN